MNMVKKKANIKSKNASKKQTKSEEGKDKGQKYKLAYDNTKKQPADSSLSSASIEMIKKLSGTRFGDIDSRSVEGFTEIPTTGEELLQWARDQMSFISTRSNEESCIELIEELENDIPSSPKKKTQSQKKPKKREKGGKKQKEKKKAGKKSKVIQAEKVTDEDILDPNAPGPLEDEVMFQWRLKREEQRRLSRRKIKSEVTFLDPTVEVERSSIFTGMKKERRKTKISLLAVKKEAQRILESEKEEQKRREDLFQEAILKQQQDEDEEILREQRNSVTLKRINKFVKERIDHVWDQLRKSEEEHYRTCQKIPLVTKADQLTAFAKKWKNDIEDMSIDELGEICSVNLELLSRLKELDFYTSRNDPEKINKWNWASRMLRDVQKEMLERAMFKILSNIYKNLKIDNLDYGEFHHSNSSFTLSIWLKLDWPVSLPDPRKPSEPSREIYLDGLDITCILPQSIQFDHKALICLYVHYDHVSDTSETFFPLPKPEYFTKDLSQTINEDKLRKQKYAYESFIRSEYMEMVEKYKQKHPEHKYPKPFLLPEIPLNEDIPKTPAQYLDPTPNEYIDLADDIFYENCLKSIRRQTVEYEVNLREYQLVGGLYMIQLMYHLPQPQPLVKLHMTVRTVTQPKKLEIVPFYKEFHPPSLPWLYEEPTKSLSSTTKSLKNIRSRRLTARYGSKIHQRQEGSFDPEEVQKLKDVQKEWEHDVQLEREKLISITLCLPADVIFLENPSVCLWNETSNSWNTRGIHEVDFEHMKRRITFRSSRFGLFGLSVKKYMNYPYKNWDIRPNSDDSISIVLEGSKVTINLNIQESIVRIEDFEYRLSEFLVGQKGLNCLKCKNFSLSRFIEVMQSSGLDMFPDYDANCYYTATTEKHWGMAYVTYYAMAQAAIRYNFASSKWNAETGRRSIIFRVREFDPNEDVSVLRTFDLVQTTLLRCQVLTCTEDDENFSDEATSLYKPNLQYLLKSMSNVTNRAKIKEFSPTTMYTLAELLTYTRIFSFS